MFIWLNFNFGLSFFHEASRFCDQNFTELTDCQRYTVGVSSSEKIGIIQLSSCDEATETRAYHSRTERFDEMINNTVSNC